MPTESLSNSTGWRWVVKISNRGDLRVTAKWLAGTSSVVWFNRLINIQTVGAAGG